MTLTTKRIVTAVFLITLAAGSFFTGLKMGARGYVYSGKDFQIINQNKSSRKVDYSLLWQVMDIINTKYIDKPVDQQKLLYGAVAGLVAATGDPYTAFFDPKQYAEFKTELSGTFEGIGAEVGMKDGHVVIVAPLEGSPAKKAGLLSGDIILKIDDVDATSYSLDQAVNKIRGPKGTKVKLQIFRQNQKQPLDFSIVRETIDITSVKFSTQNQNGKNIEVIIIDRFGDDTLDKFRQAAIDAQNKKVSGIILDLRDDPGGYLDSAVAIASYWVEPGKLVVGEAHSDGTTKQYTALGNNILSSIPTVALINGGSASAAEILAGALHDYGFAKLLGEKSFGKGSVQELVNLPYDSAVKVTVAKWLTPKGTNINHNGLDPDIKVVRTSDQSTAKQDPQMDKAVELLK